MMEDRNPRDRSSLRDSSGRTLGKRPLIGVPTGQEKSQRFFGLALYIMNQSYIRALENVGALPVLIPLQMSEATLRSTFERLDGLFLAGGEDMDPRTYDSERKPHLGATDKERDRTELLLTEWAMEIGMPVLGVCRGIQVINVACGGTLYQDLNSEQPDFAKHDYFPPNYERFRISHGVKIEAESRLANSLGTRYEVNSMHHQGIERLGSGLHAVAVTDDGLIEGVEAPEMPFLIGVQWHPEELARTDSQSSNLFFDFVRAAAEEWRIKEGESSGARIRQVLPIPRASQAVSAIEESSTERPVAFS